LKVVKKDGEDLEMVRYTLGLFANMYPANDSDTKGIFIYRMVVNLEKNGVRVIKAVKSNRSPFGYFTFYLQSMRNLLRNDIDILQAEYIPHSSIIPALLKQKRPLVLRFHGTDGRIFPYKNKFNRFLTCSMIKRADHIIVTSNEIRERLIGLGASTSHISIIPCGVDTNKFHSLDQEECRDYFQITHNRQVFLFLGRIHTKKGVYELIEAANLNPEIFFVFAGPGSPPPHPDNCTFLGRVSPVDVPVLINSSDCLVLPSYTEGLPGVLMESLACEVPVISTNVGGCPEIIIDKENGYLIEPQNVTQLSDAIVKMSKDDINRANMGKHGRKMILDKFSSQICIDKIIKIHQDLIEGNR